MPQRWSRCDTIRGARTILGCFVVMLPRQAGAGEPTLLLAGTYSLASTYASVSMGYWSLVGNSSITSEHRAGASRMTGRDLLPSE